MEDCGDAPETPPAGYVYAPCPLSATCSVRNVLCPQRARRQRKSRSSEPSAGAGCLRRTSWTAPPAGTSAPSRTSASAQRGSSPTRRTSSATRRRRLAPSTWKGGWHATWTPTTTARVSGGCCLSRSPSEGSGPQTSSGHPIMMHGRTQGAETAGGVLPCRFWPRLGSWAETQERPLHLSTPLTARLYMYSPQLTAEPIT